MNPSKTFIKQRQTRYPHPQIQDACSRCFPCGPCSLFLYCPSPKFDHSPRQLVPLRVFMFHGVWSLRRERKISGRCQRHRQAGGDASFHALCPKANVSKCFCVRRMIPVVTPKEPTRSPLTQNYFNLPPAPPATTLP